jgi:RimJ/RimL family protein N-acetyltransferase
MYLETERLLIRDITLDDKQTVFNYRSDAEANKFQSWIPETLEDANSLLKEIIKNSISRKAGIRFLITEKDTKTVIGDIGIYFFGSENLQTELGITLNKDFQGRGYASEALKGVINFLFSDLKNTESWLL